MLDYRAIERQLMKTLGLAKRPVAVRFQESAPEGVAQFQGSEPSGCSFWRLAAGGRTFFTVQGDHYNCPVGSYTHRISIPENRARELPHILSMMEAIGYVKMEEVPGIPQLAEEPGAVVYAPLGDTPVEPDVVLFAGPAEKIMILQEAAVRAGRAAQFPILGRPTCMALPAAMKHGAIVSTGCIGNRVYTGLGEGELYVVVPGKDLAAIANAAETVAGANQLLAEYHSSRREQLASE